MRNDSTEILAIIPARGGSKGIPGKNMKLLGGVPLICHAIRTARESRLLTRIILSTDSPEIREAGLSRGIEVPFLRPGEFSADTSPARDYVRHCLDYLHRQENYTPGIILILQPTTPFRTPGDIDACIELILAGDADSVITVSKMPPQFHPLWQITVAEDGEARLYGDHPWDQIVTRRQDLPPTYIRNGAVYAFRHSTFAETGTIYGNKVIAHIMPQESSINIDDMDDWNRAEKILQQWQIDN